MASRERGRPCIHDIDGVLGVCGVSRGMPKEHLGIGCCTMACSSLQPRLSMKEVRTHMPPRDEEHRPVIPKGWRQHQGAPLGLAAACVRVGRNCVMAWAGFIPSAQPLAVLLMVDEKPAWAQTGRRPGGLVSGTRTLPASIEATGKEQ